MKVYLVSLLVGLLVGAIYGVVGVRSPAPPVVALIGLLGMLLGEQCVAIARRVGSGKPVTSAWVSRQCVPPIVGTNAPHRASGDAESSRIAPS